MGKPTYPVQCGALRRSLVVPSTEWAIKESPNRNPIHFLSTYLRGGNFGFQVYFRKLAESFVMATWLEALSGHSRIRESVALRVSFRLP